MSHLLPAAILWQSDACLWSKCSIVNYGYRPNTESITLRQQSFLNPNYLALETSRARFLADRTVMSYCRLVCLSVRL